MEPVHTEKYEQGKGNWKETTTHKNYFFDKATGKVTLVTTEDCDNAYPNQESYSDRETERRILAPEEIPPTVRRKIDELVKKK